MKYLSIVLVCTVLFFSCGKQEKQSTDSDEALVSYVNPFIGTGGHGHTFPGATLPFGMMQLSPDTRLEGWDGCGGYHYTDSIVYGFSHTHLSGTGVSDYGDILLKPCIGEQKMDNGYTSNPSEGYASYFNKDSEVASPGYYAMSLEEGIDVQLASTLRAAMHKYTWNRAENPHVVLDLHHRDFLLDAHIVVENDSVVTGFRSSNAWANDQRVYFCMEFSRPINQSNLNAGIIRPSADSSGKSTTKAFFDFKLTEGESVLIRVGISAVDVEGARKNLHSEINHWDFEKVRTDAAAVWEAELSKIRVE
jgi:predicted alpha-1,2-mannosidase